VLLSEITKMLIAVLKIKFIASFTVIFGALSFPAVYYSAATLYTTQVGGVAQW